MITSYLTENTLGIIGFFLTLSIFRYFRRLENNISEPPSPEDGKGPSFRNVVLSSFFGVPDDGQTPKTECNTLSSEPCRICNTRCPHYKDQSVNAIQGNNHWLYDNHEIDACVGGTPSLVILNYVAHTFSIVLY
jgi:hypothetical protein